MQNRVFKDVSTLHLDVEGNLALDLLWESVSIATISKILVLLFITKYIKELISY
jgi:hypothetical protein